MEALRCLRSYCRVSRRLATKFPSNGRATGDRRSMQPQSRHRSRQWSVQNEVVSHRYSIAAPIARKICDRGRFLGSAARSFRRVSFGRTVAVTAIEHGNIVITVASLIRESGPDAVLFRRFGKRTPLHWLAAHPEATRIRRSVEEIAASGLTLAKLMVAANLQGDLVKG